ncbi:unnamed protein product [Ascophyllum nodosum]
MDPRSVWALGEFREAPIELRLLDSGDDASVQDSGRHTGPLVTNKATPARRIVYQGERLVGLLVVGFDAGAGEAGDARLHRWRKFGRDLNVELEIITEAVTATGDALTSEEPSLWRDYEGRENARDKGVLTRSNHVLSIHRETPVTTFAPGELAYALDVEVQVPVEFLGQAVALEALVSPTSVGQTEDVNAATLASANSADRAGANLSTGGRRGGAGGDFATRLDSLFALSRIATVRLPVTRCFLPLRVVQPIAVTSRSWPPASSSGVAVAPLGRNLIALELRNEHPVAKVTLHDVETHVDTTAPCGERASSQGFSAPGKAATAGRGGAAARARRKMSGGAATGGAAAPLEGLEGTIEQPPLVGSSPAGDLSRLFRASWVVKPPLPLTLAPGEVQGFVLTISPRAEPLPPRRAGGRFETPISFFWTLDSEGLGNGGASGGGWYRPGAAPTPPQPGQSYPTTSVHLAQWQAEPRAPDEVLVRVKGHPRVQLNRVFEVSLRVRNLAPGPRDLVLMFTEDAADQRALSLEGVRPGTTGYGAGSGVVIETDDEDDGDARDISPAISPVRPARGASSFSAGGRARNPNPGTRILPVGDRVLGAVSSPSQPARPSLGALLPLDAAVPLGRLERGAERGTTVRLTAARSGLARLSSLRVKDALTGAVYAPGNPYEVFVES